MSDSVSLQIGGKRITSFLEYRAEADLYTADDAFSMVIKDPKVEVSAGQQCELYVNDTLELTGIIDRCIRSHDKSGRRLRIEGRDLMGLVVDSYCEQFVDVQGTTVKSLAEMLLRTVPFINRKNIVYQENIIGKLKGKKQTVSQPAVGFLDTPQKISKIDPGMTVFEVLSTYAASRGLMFYSLPDGTFVFGRPKAGGEPAFFLTCNEDGNGNNTNEGELLEDISKRYSKVTIISQGQGFDDDGMDTNKVNTPVSRDDKTFPFYKPFVTRLTNDSQSPELAARLLLEKQQHEGFQLSYKVPRHSQNGRNWTINELATVRDEKLGLNDTYLIFGRVFELTKEGMFTRLKLGYPGVVA
jgi:prophage tail gpP-like protein